MSTTKFFARKIQDDLALAQLVVAVIGLQTWAGLNLASIYGGRAVIALALAALSFAIAAPATAST